MSEIRRGGLICPSNSFAAQIKEFETHFKAFHGEEHCKQNNVIKTLCDQICAAYLSVSLLIVRKYENCLLVDAKSEPQCLIADADTSKFWISLYKANGNIYDTLFMSICPKLVKKRNLA
jgi:hypothetical protein